MLTDGSQLSEFSEMQSFAEEGGEPDESQPLNSNLDDDAPRDNTFYEEEKENLLLDATENPNTEETYISYDSQADLDKRLNIAEEIRDDLTYSLMLEQKYDQYKKEMMPRKKGPFQSLGREHKKKFILQGEKQTVQY